MLKEAKKEDIFQQIITKIIYWYYHQRQRFFIVIGAVVAIIAIVIIYFSTTGKENPEVQLRFTEALGLYSTQNFDAAEERFTDFSRRFSGHYLAAKAHFYLGNIYFSRQEFDKAHRAFSQAYGKLKKDPILGPATLLAIGNCYEEKQNLKKAAETYEKVFERYKKSKLAGEALIAAARCYKNLNDLSRAERIYEKVIKHITPGEVVETAKAELAYIKALRNKF
ncbi:MAG: tetratricopeptide repeat protein [candidate division WOR-3 bacterium]|nr:tetratricopeptide repeat protein [candidate division WOR-3 bacterium]